MFIGHYSAALVIKSAHKELSLGWLFIAVQLVDIVFFPLVYFGVERFNIVPHFTASTHFELEFMPYTHGLVSSFGWALLAFIVYRLISPSTDRTKAALLIALAVLSHWFFDLLMHTPDLPLLGDNSIKLGIGLWNNAYLTFAIEALLIGIALYIYLRSTVAVTQSGKYAMLLFVASLILINIVNIFGPPPSSRNEVIISAMASYFVFAGFVYWLDSKRT